MYCRFWLSPCFLLLAANLLAAGEPFLWIEGESAVQKKVFGNPWFDAVAPGELSGGALISSFSETGQPTGTAEYALDIPQAGKYHFWIRAGSRGTGMAYRLDGGDWVPANLGDLIKEDQKNRKTKGYQPKTTPETNVALDGKPARFLAVIV